jgi:predicted N-acyltransferase
VDNDFPKVRSRLVTRAELAQVPRWTRAFADQRKDHRYYEIVEDTIRGFDYRYIVVADAGGTVRAVQPCFVLDQDLLQGAGRGIAGFAARLRRYWPRFLYLRTLMVGCAAGEAHIDADAASAPAAMELLAAALPGLARGLGTPLVVLKEFPARHRAALACFRRAGFACIPSMPATLLSISYASFDDYMSRALSGKMRKDLRRKSRAAERSAPIEMSVIDDIGTVIDEVYPLYLAVYERSKLRFEKLTKDYFCRLGRDMPDKVRFFIWRQNGRIVAFTLCMIEDETLYGEYVGFDYAIALDLHLYHYAFRDVVTWAIANGFKTFGSTGLNYDPKLHLRHRLDPLDLYVKHTSPFFNALLKRLLPLLEPTRQEKILRKFPNYDELWNRTTEDGGRRTDKAE